MHVAAAGIREARDVRRGGALARATIPPKERVLFVPRLLPYSHTKSNYFIMALLVYAS